MNNQQIRTEFVFVGYQMRKYSLTSQNLTLATNVNPLYFPEDDKLKKRFEELLSSCRHPYFLGDVNLLAEFCQIALLDAPISDSNIKIVRCALLERHVSVFAYEYFDEHRELVHRSFDRASLPTEDPRIEQISAGFDVIDASEVGGYDSAIHTYRIFSTQLNENGLVKDVSEAVKMKQKADEDLPEHGPFTVWEVGCPLRPSEIVEKVSLGQRR